MSVILESLAGDELYCLEEFVTSPHGQPFSWKSGRKIRVGERVRFVSWYEDQHVSNNPVCWMVIFEAADGKRYAGTQTYFVTAECWHGLRKYFGRQRRKTAEAKKTKAGSQRSVTRKKQVVVSG